MGLAQSALILLGIGIVSSRFKAGTGLGELGSGISTLVAAPLVGTGTGLSTFAGGIRDLSTTLGDLGRGIGALFENIPKLPPTTPGNGNGQQLESFPIFQPKLPLITNAAIDLAPGGGIRVPSPGPAPSPPIMRTQPVILPALNTRPTAIYSRNRDIVML